MATDSLVTSLETILECAEYSVDPVCRAFVAPYWPVPFDVCSTDKDGGNGQLWVAVQQVTQGYPTSTGRPKNCDAYTANLELGVIRCQQSKIQDEGIPTLDQLQADLDLVHADRVGLLDALVCCYNDDSLILTAWNPAQGGDCIGGIWTFQIRVGVCVCREDS